MIGETLLNYRVTEKLGEGGQGTVYKAIDTKLDRPVVIKVLAPGLTAKAINLRRFEREARLASSLDHPNICTIYGLHEHAGAHYIVMQYVAGRNVRELVNNRPLELQSALSIAVQTADALAAAHKRGVIHRDIKAGNVMVTDAGVVKVLDFGLAKLVADEQRADAGRAGDDVHLTEIGVPYGTATYAAPEQARGEPTDARCDIFSTGVLLYEMLAGTWPFRGKSSVEVRYAVLNEEPRPVAEVRGSVVPDSVVAIIDRALAKRPADRYADAGELRDALRAALNAVVDDESATPDAARRTDLPHAPIAPRHLKASRTSGTLRGLWRRLTGDASHGGGTSTSSAGGRDRATQSPQSLHATGAAHQSQHQSQSAHVSSRASASSDRSEIPNARSIAVLPFRNLSGDAELGFYEFSLADAVITELARRQRALVVRPSSVIAKYTGDAREPREIGRELAVTSVLAASFLRAGERLRVTAQLLDVESGALVWSDRIDAASADVLTLQDTIAEHIAEGLHLEGQSAKPDAPVTANVTAYEEYLRGRDAHGRFIYHTLAREDSDAAISHFERAIKLDPSFALAHCALGSAHANRVIKGIGSREDFDLAEKSLEQALALDSQLLEARMHMVFVYLSRGEKERARAWSELMSREAPQDVGVHFVRATIHRLDGEHDKALRSLDRMLRLNPAERLVVGYNRARVFLYQNRITDALAELDMSAREEPRHPLVRLFRAIVLLRTARHAEATEIVRDLLAERPEMDAARPVLAAALALDGRVQEARDAITARARDVAASDHDIAYWLACAYAVLDDRDAAFDWLRRAIELGNENRPWFEADSLLENLRADPRFDELMQRTHARG